MKDTQSDAAPGKGALWAGRVLSGLVVLFLLGASVVPKLVVRDVGAAAMNELGWPPQHLLLIGVLELVGTLLYAFPRTAVLGASFLTAVFGGAVATHLRINNPMLSHTLFPVYLGLVMWGGLLLRMPRLRTMLWIR
jgi:hypothetical protein